MKDNEPLVLEKNRVGNVELRFDQIIRNLNKFIEIEIKHNSPNRGFVRIYAEQSKRNKDHITLDL